MNVEFMGHGTHHLYFRDPTDCFQKNLTKIKNNIGNKSDRLVSECSSDDDDLLILFTTCRLYIRSNDDMVKEDPG